MGPVLVIAGAVLTVLLFVIFGYVNWVLAVAGSLWVIALGLAAKFGHRSFGTRANTDLTIVMVGFAITAAVAMPKFSEHQPCNRTVRTAMQIGSAQRDWKKTHPGYATQLSDLQLKLDKTVTVKLELTDTGYVATATHPECVDESGAVIPSQATSDWD